MLRCRSIGFVVNDPAARALPTPAQIAAALAEARVGDEDPSDDEADEKMNGHRTALIKTDPEYFGFVG